MIGVEFATGSRTWGVFPRHWGPPPTNDADSEEHRGWVRGNARADQLLRDAETEADPRVLRVQLLAHRYGPTA